MAATAIPAAQAALKRRADAHPAGSAAPGMVGAAQRALAKNGPAILDHAAAKISQVAPAAGIGPSTSKLAPGWRTVHQLATRIDQTSQGSATEANRAREAWLESSGTERFNAAHKWLNRTSTACGVQSQVDLSARAVAGIAYEGYGPNWKGFTKVVSDVARAVALFNLLPNSERTSEAYEHFQTLIGPAVTAGWLTPSGTVVPKTEG